MGNVPTKTSSVIAGFPTVEFGTSVPRVFVDVTGAQRLGLLFLVLAGVKSF